MIRSDRIASVATKGKCKSWKAVSGRGENTAMVSCNALHAACSHSPRSLRQSSLTAPTYIRSHQDQSTYCARRPLRERLIQRVLLALKRSRKRAWWAAGGTTHLAADPTRRTRSDIGIEDRPSRESRRLAMTPNNAVEHALYGAEACKAEGGWRVSQRTNESST